MSDPRDPLRLAIDLPLDAPAYVETVDGAGAWLRIATRFCSGCEKAARELARSRGEALDANAGVHGVHVFISMN